MLSNYDSGFIRSLSLKQYVRLYKADLARRNETQMWELYLAYVATGQVSESYEQWRQQLEENQKQKQILSSKEKDEKNAAFDEAFGHAKEGDRS